jgi:predicted glutamine amidotransferase
MAVTEMNVHPFSYDRFMWMHNGSIAGFHLMRRRLRESLKDEFYNMIQGTTDSEHAFAVFLNSLQVPFGEASGDDLRRALTETITRLNEWTHEANITEPSYYNFAVTDGRAFIVSRYCSAAGIAGASLHYSRGLRFECLPDGVCDMHNVPDDEQAAAVIISSERLTDDESDWPDVPDNHTVTVLPDLSVKVEELNV